MTRLLIHHVIAASAVPASRILSFVHVPPHMLCTTSSRGYAHTHRFATLYGRTPGGVCCTPCDSSWKRGALKLGVSMPLMRVRIWCQPSRVVVRLQERRTSHGFEPSCQIRITPGQEPHPGFALDVRPLLAFSRSRRWVAVRERSAEGHHDLLSGI